MLDFGFYNMDCMDGMKSLPNNYADLTLTDIPYNEVNKTKPDNGLRIMKKGNADICTFDLDSFLEEVWRVTKKTIIIFCARGQMSKIHNFFFDKQASTVRQLIWEKTNPSPINGDKVYLSGIENAIWCKKTGVGGVFNAFCKNTVFRYPIGTSEIHPTEKNHALLRELIEDNSNVGDIVFDPCSGSASTLLVAHNMGRKYMGFELSKEYYDLASKRLNNEVAQMTIFDYLGGQ